MGRAATATETVKIGSKLPNGLILKHPLEPTTTVLIKGLNGAPKGTNGDPISVPYMVTEVDADFWEAWKTVHVTKDRKAFAPFASGAIFECGSDPEKSYREREKEKTGLERLSMSDSGVKPADKE